MLIRDADISDLKDIFEWRNDFLSRRMSIISEMVTLAEHNQWFQNSLKNPRRRIYIGLIDDQKIGVVRFDLNVDASQSEVSINLNPKLRGNGYGYTLLSKSIILYKQSNDLSLIARIKKGNKASIKIFSRCKFRIKSEDDSICTLIRV